MTSRKLKETGLAAVFILVLCLASADSPVWEVFILTKILALGIVAGGIWLWTIMKQEKQ
jgi:hypothetical protein